VEMDLLQGNVVPAEGESTVRTYHCTYYREKALGLKSGGFLGVTNKRVIFQAAGDTPSGRSVIQSEVPIADVSGINSFKGTYFDLFAFLGALLLAGLAMIFIPAILTGLGFILESYTFFQIIGWLLAIGAFFGSFFISVKLIWRTFLIGISAGSLLSLAGTQLLDTMSVQLFTCLCVLLGTPEDQHFHLRSIQAAVRVRPSTFPTPVALCMFQHLVFPTPCQVETQKRCFRKLEH